MARRTLAAAAAALIATPRPAAWLWPLVMLAIAPTAAGAHDWYEGLKSPSGERCCSGRDCSPVEERYNPETRRTEVGIEGVWVPVDPAKLVNVPSPDGAAHACYERYWMRQKMTPIVRCIFLPGDA